MKTPPEFSQHIMGLIGQNKIKEAIQATQGLLQSSPLLGKLLVQSARYNKVMEAIHLNTIDLDKASIEQNKINFALVNILQEMEEGATANPALAQELEAFLKGGPDSSQISAQVKGEGNVTIQGVKHSNVSVNTGNTSNQKADKIYNIDQIDKADFS